MIFSSGQARFVIKAFAYVQKTLGNGFQTRTGFTQEQATQLSDKIGQAADAAPGDGLAMVFSRDELSLINNVLNEACNGISIADFSGVFTFERQDAQALLATVNSSLTTAK
jgi:hypothetical protein